MNSRKKYKRNNQGEWVLDLRYHKDKRRVTVSRPILGCTINGDEYLLDKDNYVMTFASVCDAQNHLMNHGVEVRDLESYNFNEEAVEAWNK